MTISEVAESDWATAWKKYYHPVRVTRFLTIVPSWEAYHAQDEAEKIITSGHGFRYRHASNDSFNLAALETVLRGGETVLDVGTGSGVLSIASRYLG